MDRSNPFALLQNIEVRVRSQVRQLPHRGESKPVWSGIIFRLGDLELAAPLLEVSEVLAYPAVARVPGTQSWVRGIANFRGNLLPIMDLRTLLEGVPVVRGRKNRVLVVNHQEIFAGLLVDEIIGLRHFLREERSTEPPPTEIPLVVAHLQGGFERNGRYTPIFGLHALAESAEFMQVTT